MAEEGWIKHIVQVLTFQHNDYRCIFENGIVGIQYGLLGHTNLKVLSILADLLVIPLFGVLYLTWRKCGRPPEYTLLAFVPVSWMLFQLQYEGTLNFATPGFQCIPVVLFALLTCLLATKTTTRLFRDASQPSPLYRLVWKWIILRFQSAPNLFPAKRIQKTGGVVLC